MGLRKLPVPVPFDPKGWPTEPTAPQGYCLRLGIDDLRDVIKTATDDGQGNSRLRLLGKLVIVTNLQLTVPAGDPNYPIYFDIEGTAFDYVVSIWLDRITIEVHAKNGKLQSVLWPTTAEQLNAALRTIVNDS